MSDELRSDARTIWQAAVAAARPGPLVRRALADLADVLDNAPRILVLGAGKAGAAMAAAVEHALADRLDRVEGIVNVPADPLTPCPSPQEGRAEQLRKIRLHAARPSATNFPTADGVAGALEMLRLAESPPPKTSPCACFPAAARRSCPHRPQASPWPINLPSPGCCTIAAPPSTK